MTTGARDHQRNHTHARTSPSRTSVIVSPQAAQPAVAPACQALGLRSELPDFSGYGYDGQAQLLQSLAKVGIKSGGSQSLPHMGGTVYASPKRAAPVLSVRGVILLW